MKGLFNLVDTSNMVSVVVVILIVFFGLSMVINTWVQIFRN